MRCDRSPLPYCTCFESFHTTWKATILSNPLSSRQQQSPVQPGIIGLGFRLLLVAGRSGDEYRSGRCAVTLQLHRCVHGYKQPTIDTGHIRNRAKSPSVVAKRTRSRLGVLQTSQITPNDSRYTRLMLMVYFHQPR